MHDKPNVFHPMFDAFLQVSNRVAFECPILGYIQPVINNNDGNFHQVLLWPFAFRLLQVQFWQILTGNETLLHLHSLSGYFGHNPTDWCRIAVLHLRFTGWMHARLHSRIPALQVLVWEYSFHLEFGGDGHFVILSFFDCMEISSITRKLRGPISVLHNLFECFTTIDNADIDSKYYLLCMQVG